MVSRTFNQLHFEDLDPIRFEELVLSIVYRMRRWLKLDHYGKKGSDDGIDIRAVEELENGKIKNYVIQCKRYNKIDKNQLKKIIDSYKIKNNYIPDVYILVISCSITKKNLEYFEKYSKEIGLDQVIVWTNSLLECKLFNEYQDLLFAFFGINLTEKRNQKMNSIRRNLNMKKKMKRDFLNSNGYKNNEEILESIRKPWQKFNNTKVLIRSIADVTYPENTLLDIDYTGYFKAEVYDFYHNGLLVIIGIKEIKIKVNEGENNKKINVGKEKVLEIGYLPYENIIEYDYEGDEFYMYPHLYCDFVNRQDPFEKIGYASYSDEEGSMLINDYLILDKELK